MLLVCGLRSGSCVGGAVVLSLVGSGGRRGSGGGGSGGRGGVRGWCAAVALLVVLPLLAVGGSAGAQSESAESSGSGSETVASGSASVAESSAAGSSDVGVVLSGSFVWGSGTSSSSGFVGYSSPSVPGGAPRAGSFVPVFWDRGVVRVPSELFALAQLDGAVVSGPASGLSDPVVLRLGQRVDLGSGFIVEVAGRSLFSAGAADPAGHKVGSGFRYWMWDAPCADWQDGASAEMRLIKLEADDSRQGANTDTKLSGLAVDGAVLDAVFDPAASTHAATAAASTAQVTVDAAANAHACDVNIAPGDADPDTAGHQVDLGAAGTDTTVTVTVTAADNTTAAVHTLTIARGASARASSLTLSGTEGLGFDPGKRRYDTTPAAGSTSTTVDMAPVGDAVLEGFAVTAGDTEVAEIGDDGTVELTAGKDTLVAVRAATADNESQTVYTVRLRGTQQSQSDQGSQGQGSQSDQGSRGSQGQGFQGQGDQGSQGQRVGRRSFSASGAVAKGIHATGGAPAGSWTRDVGDPFAPPAADPPAADPPAADPPAADPPAADPPAADPPAAEPRLTALDVTPGTLTPAFDAATHAYDVSVMHDTEHITVTPTATSTADAMIDLSDADPDTDGHQVALNAARPGGKPAQTAILVTVTDGTVIDSYTLTVTREAPPPRIGARADTLAAFAREPAKDFTEADLGYNYWDPVGIWSDGTDMWVIFDTVSERLVAYNLATKERRTDRTFRVDRRAWTNPPMQLAAPYDLWSDGTHLWVVDHYWCLIFAYDSATGVNRPDMTMNVQSTGTSCALRPTDLGGSRRYRTTGIWSDGDTMWVAYWDSAEIWGYSMATGARQPEHDITTLAAAGAHWPAALWSDGETMWVADADDTHIYAFDLDDGARRSELEFTNAVLAPANISSLNGIWSDGTTMWATDIGRHSYGHQPMYATGSGESGIYAFRMPTSAALNSLTISGVDFGTFQTGIMSYTATAPSGTTSATVGVAAAFPDDVTVAVSYAAADGTTGTGNTVTLSQGVNTITVTAAYGTADTRTYTVTVTVAE